MPTLTDIAAIRKYADGVHNRVRHHGESVKAIWPAVMGYILAYCDDPRAVLARSGVRNRTANQVWARFAGKRYSISYSKAKVVEVRDGQTVLARFDNDTKLLRLWEFFEQLAGAH